MTDLNTQSRGSTNQPIVSSAAPAWLLAVFNEIDTKGTGDAFDVLSDDVQMEFGTGRWRGREVIRTKLREFDEHMDTRHIIHTFWDCGAVKMFYGEITTTDHGSGKIATAAVCHFFYMDEQDPGKVRRWIGAAGPFGLD